MTGCALQLLSSAGAILLQREIPEAVNIEVAKVQLAACMLHSFLLLHLTPRISLTQV